jgi:hypothetical protein
MSLGRENIQEVHDFDIIGSLMGMGCIMKSLFADALGMPRVTDEGHWPTLEKWKIFVNSTIFTFC